MSAESLVNVPLFLENGDPIGITAKIPPFKKPPDVLLWGSRVFQRRASFSAGLRSDYEYRECFAVTVVVTGRT